MESFFTVTYFHTVKIVCITLREIFKNKYNDKYLEIYNDFNLLINEKIDNNYKKNLFFKKYFKFVQDLNKTKVF